MSIENSEMGLKTTLYGIIINSALAIIKGIAGYIGNSYALIADAIESSSDVLSSLIVYVGIKFSTKPRDESHPYGHGKAEPIAAIVVTIALFAAAATIITQSISEIRTPHHAPEPFTLGVLVAVVITKELLFRKVNKVGKAINSTAVNTDSWHHRSDAITSAAVFIGILVALIGGEGWESADDWAALIASLIIIANAIFLFIPAFNEIMDAKPQGNLSQLIHEKANEVKGVVATEKCIVRKMGLEFVVDLHVQVNSKITVKEGHEIAHLVKDKLLAAGLNILEVNIHIEPADEQKHLPDK